MKIKKFRIWNYRSIIDSGDCYPTDSVTILAGKNESGKSSVLQALEDFDIDRSIREKAVPIGGNEKPKISIWFLINREDIQAVLETIAFPTEAALPEEVELCICKEYPDIYSLDCHVLRSIGIDSSPQDYRNEIVSLYQRIQTTTITAVASRIGIPIPDIDASDKSGALTTIKTYQAQIAPHLGNWSTTDQQELKYVLKKLINLLGNATSNPRTWEDAFFNELGSLIPNFILFSSFDDVFPNEIPLSSLADSAWIKDLQEMSDISVDTILGADQRAKKSHKNQLNINLNNDFGRFWTQDLSRLSIDWDSEKLYFWIEENGNYYEPEIRSQGRRWHLAFYIRVTARAREDVKNVILIDEPGLYLHANAQRDVLKNLDDASSETQVIFSTHSPYLIEADRLDRVRLIRKLDGKGTVIENKIHAVSDKETLTPILTAIGLELNQGIVAAERTNNVIVEGPSDYFYLTAFKELLGKKDVNFISGGGAGNMPKVGTILQGWGCDVIYLYDNDKSYKEARKYISSAWVTITSELLTKIPVDGSIEDIFTKGDFANYVLGVKEQDIGASNSTFMNGKDKVLPARQFLGKARDADTRPKLSEATTKQISKLFDELAAKFDGYPH